MKLILCSGSPRRRELMGEMGLEFTVDTRTTFDEGTLDPCGLSVQDYVSELALGKNLNFVRALVSDEVLISADTIVACGSKIYGKPHTREVAIQMLTELSGREHEVLTALCVRFGSDGSIRREVSVSKVLFAPMTQAEIEHYVDVYQPLDKAGAYGIQEWIGMNFIERISGSYYSIMGLDTCLLNKMLK